MECKWFAKPQRRSKIILNSKLHRYTPTCNQSNTFYKQKLL